MRTEVILSRIRNLEDKFEQLPLAVRSSDSSSGDGIMAGGSSAAIQEAFDGLKTRVEAMEKDNKEMKEFVGADGSLADAWQAINGLQEFQSDFEQITGGCAC